MGVAEARGPADWSIRKVWYFVPCSKTEVVTRALVHGAARGNTNVRFADPKDAERLLAPGKLSKRSATDKRKFMVSFYGAWWIRRSWGKFANIFR